jgi:hypothetical protein
MLDLRIKFRPQQQGTDIGSLDGTEEELMQRHEAVRRKDERQSREVRPMMMRPHAQRAAFHDCVCLV